MKKKNFTLLLFLLISVCAFAQIEKLIPPVPNPPRLVNDFAHALTPEQVEILENKLKAYDDSTSTQIAVVTMTTTGDYPIEDVALGILRKWGVGGRREKDNGIVILAAIQDRKVWIATGYGMEGAIPDITAKAIIENDILPHFRSENYYRGFEEATNSIIKAAAGEYKAPEGYREKRSGISIGKIIVLIIILFVILTMMGGGGNGGGFMSRRGYRGFGGPVIFPGGWGGSSGGGFGGFGGGGGGGFGGFGGGSGGGGGAGGSW